MDAFTDRSALIAVGSEENVAVSLSAARAVVVGVAAEVLDAGLTRNNRSSEAGEALSWFVVCASSARQLTVFHADSD